MWCWCPTQDVPAQDASSATEDGMTASIPAHHPSSSAQGDIVAAKGWRQRDPSVSGTTVKDETKLRKECKETLKCVSDGLKENLKLVRNCVYRSR